MTNREQLTQEISDIITKAVRGEHYGKRPLDAMMGILDRETADKDREIERLKGEADMMNELYKDSLAVYESQKQTQEALMGKLEIAKQALEEINLWYSIHGSSEDYGYTNSKDALSQL